MPIKSFRGKLAKGTQQTISLHTNDGSTGYRIKKFQIMGITENETYEATIQIFSIPQEATTAIVDFSDNTLLAAALYLDSGSSSVSGSQTVIFDNVTFNQDIYVTYDAIAAASDMNYYIELETVKLPLDQNTVATLKDIRNIMRD
jgi:hypothetical protein